MPHPPKIQLDNPLHPNDAKASLGQATLLQSMLLPAKQAQTTAQNAEPAPQPPTNQETGSDVTSQIQGLESRVFDEIGTLKDMIQKAEPQDANKELQDLKNQLQGIIDAKE